MKSLLLRKIIFSVLACLLFFSALPSAPQALAAGTVPPDGVYPITFRYVKDNSTATSAADEFVEKDTGKLIVQDGKILFEHEVTKTFHATFAYFALRKPGAPKAVVRTVDGVESATGMEGYAPASIREAADPDRVVYQFEIDDLSATLDVLMHIHDQHNIFNLPENYNHWYNAQLELHVATIPIPNPPGGGDDENNEDLVVTIEMFNERVTVAYSVYHAAVEGTGDGMYPPGSRHTLLTRVESAEQLAASAPGNAGLLKAAYLIVDEALKAFQAQRIAVDKSRLIQWVAAASAWVANAKDGGETESGAPARPTGVAVTAGEYPADTSVNPPSGPAAKTRQGIADAQRLLANAAATQADVNALYNALSNTLKWDELEKQKYVAAPVTLLVLDSVDEDAKLSPYADEIRSSAVLVQNAEHPYYEGYANITILDPTGSLLDTDVRSPTLDAVKGGFAVRASTGEPSFSSSARPVVRAASTPTEKTFQIPVRSGNKDYLQTDELWQGFTVLRYPEHAPADERKTVYISFNAELLQQLNTLIAEAQQALDGAAVGTAPGQYPQTAKNALQTAVNAARETGDRLSAARPSILSATADLTAAYEQFRAAQVPGTPPNPGGPTGPGGPIGGPTQPVYPANGNYYIPFAILKNGTTETSVANSYVVSPALVKVNNGQKTVSFTVLQSNEITGLRLNGSSGSVTSRNSSANTRVVTFTLSSLSSTINGWVKVDWSALNYHHEYDIQFRFDESQAQYAGTSPDVVDGSAPGAPNLPNPGGGAPVPGNNNNPNNNPANNAATPEKEAPAAEKPSGNAGGPRNPPTAPPAVSFADTDSHWAKSQIDRAVALGIVTGYADGSFRPDDQVTRAEIAVMISRTLKLNGSASGETLQDFGDIPTWAQTHVALAVAAGILSGFEDQTFRLHENLTRAQLAVIIARAAKLELEENVELDFADAADVPTWAQREIAAAVKAGLLQGKGDNTFDPLATATRAEALTVIIRLLEAIGGE